MYLLDVMCETGIKDVEIALWATDKHLTVLWIVIDAETVQAEEETFDFLGASE